MIRPITRVIYKKKVVVIGFDSRPCLSSNDDWRFLPHSSISIQKGAQHTLCTSCSEILEGKAMASDFSRLEVNGLTTTTCFMLGGF